MHPDAPPRLLYANKKGEILDFDELEMAGSAAGLFQRPHLQELIPLPVGSELFVLPGRFPVGIDPADGTAAKLTRDPDNPADEIQAVAAFMAPAHTAVLSAAFEKQPGRDVPVLPLFAYTAVGWREGRFWVTAFRSDRDPRQDANRFAPAKIHKKTKSKLTRKKSNRLIQHLGKCCLTYSCPAAKNYFMGRWEAPIPTSPICNADCIGCISLQKSGCCPSTQERIKFVPSPHEIAEMAVEHLENAPRPVVSFGQGCEGEPLLQAETIGKSIRLIRKQTTKGTINLNSNAGLPQAVKMLSSAGLDSIRVSMNSAQMDYHSRYYRPKGFNLADVKNSIRIMKNDHKFVSLNYFILPGFTDDPEEFAALCRLLEEYAPDLIQLRNLNMDPEWYLDSIQFKPQGKAMGILQWLAALKTQFPALKFGYYNPALQ